MANELQAIRWYFEKPIMDALGGLAPSVPVILDNMAIVENDSLDEYAAIRLDFGSFTERALQVHLERIEGTLVCECFTQKNKGPGRAQEIMQEVMTQLVEMNRCGCPRAQDGVIGWTNNLRGPNFFSLDDRPYFYGRVSCTWHAQVGTRPDDDGGPTPRDRAVLWNRNLPENMPDDWKDLVNKAMDKWEEFIQPNANYTTEDFPDGTLQITRFVDDDPVEGAFAAAGPLTWENTYPYRTITGQLLEGSAWGDLTNEADQLETVVHELGHILGLACIGSIPDSPFTAINNWNEDGLIEPGSHYANLLSLWNQKSGGTGTLLPINGGFVNNDVSQGPAENYDAHWLAYLDKTVDGVRYIGVKNDIMCPGTKVTPEINIITDLTLTHLKALGYEVIKEAEGEPDFTPLRDKSDYRLFGTNGNCVALPVINTDQVALD